MAADGWADLDEKLSALAAVGRARDLETVVLRDPASLNWLLGCRVNVPQTLDSACLDVIIDLSTDSPRITLVTNAIEAPRLRDTEVADLDAQWVVVPWWESRDQGLPSGQRVGSDRPSVGVASVAADLAALRHHLTSHQRALLRSVCRETAEAATATAQRLNPTTSEFTAAGLLSRELLERGLDPIVLMVAGAARVAAHRHPLPTMEPLGARGMLVACGRRHGLVASVTRIVAFEPMSNCTRDAYDRLLRVEAAFLDATRVGASVGAAFTAGVTAYAREGFDATEWHRHHQGGFSGFQPREFPAHHSSVATINEGAVLAWNPSAAGVKVEDTSLVLASGAEPLVEDGVWPTTTVRGRRRPDVMAL